MKRTLEMLCSLYYAEKRMKCSLPSQYVYKQQAGHYIEINTRKNEWLQQNENGMNKKNRKFE